MVNGNSRAALRRPEGPAGVSQRAGSAFTLIELLVVVAIIALLVSIVLPSTSQVRELARQPICLSNQRSILTALQAYSGVWKTFPYNYGGGGGRWALECIAPYLGTGPTDRVELYNADEGEFPASYVCPSADLEAVYLSNPTDKYHACYWTNVAIRVNRGWGSLFDAHGHPEPPGWDIDSGGEARLFAKLCANTGQHWRSVYQPTFASLPMPEKSVFTGDTNNTFITHIPGYDNEPIPLYHPTYPGEWHTRPGWGWIHGSLGFDRHADKLLMSYCDGSARASTREYLNKTFAHWPPQHGEIELTGDFMLRFPDTYSCNGTRIHNMHEPVEE